jgi:hypothetical protein
LVLTGTVRSGKTATARGIAELFGLPFLAAKVEESNEADFWPGVNAGGLLTIDNADTRCRWLADALSSASTGGCSQRRKKYKEIHRRCKRCPERPGLARRHDCQSNLRG